VSSLSLPDLAFCIVEVPSCRACAHTCKEHVPYRALPCLTVSSVLQYQS
jgi:hypothetical protein